MKKYEIARENVMTTVGRVTVAVTQRIAPTSRRCLPSYMTVNPSWCPASLHR